LPTEEDDNDHALIATTTLPATLTTIPPNPAATDSEETVTNPTDHPDRPVNAKPTGAKPTDEPITQPAPAETSAPAGAGKGNSTWLPSFLPTFGVSAATQAWIYGSLVLIVLFCCGLGIYFYIARRKRLRNNPRNEYEFELLDDEEAEGLASGEKAAAGKGGPGGAGRRTTRGGELYDAFAGGSDDDDEGDEDDFGDVMRVGGAQYRDRSGSGSESSGSGSAIAVSEKLPGSRRRESEESEDHHVVGDDEDEEDGGDDEEEDDDRRQEATPLQGGSR
jgi:kexin